MIDREQVMKIAKLARLKLSEDEIVNFTGQLGSILDFVADLDKADTANVEPTCFVSPVHDPLRDDMEKPSLTIEQILSNAPASKNGFFEIPKVIG
ncbi:MAG: Asp-tRNA(Asn)/Glu-tRNA(Gln) amidotransferase subunit GatC [Chitinispirillaceae bacterium]|jgi:aspartyl-tRNA(Asn)/glutamyl-tRNA(Gln) amidotransferase subunit C|nr:Asp-tRNA(Asn)/Glu-tRNA(Gln) amidotransferase subunit GatC [Chitinispirillaceae bacterium]